jgi:hypothetical protein
MISFSLSGTRSSTKPMNSAKAALRTIAVFGRSPGALPSSLLSNCPAIGPDRALRPMAKAVKQ